MQALNEPDLGLARLCAALESAPISTLTTLKNVLESHLSHSNNQEDKDKNSSEHPRTRNKSINKFMLQFNQLNPRP
jgi:hypothetical protein